MRLEALILVLTILNLLQKDEFGPLLSTYAVEWGKKTVQMQSVIYGPRRCVKRKL